MKEYTYLAGDWNHDKDVIDIIKSWNKDYSKDLYFKDAHEITQSRDESLNCSIKDSLAKRLNESHTFVLIVGEHTIFVRSGECGYCSSYYNNRCYRGHYSSHESYIEFECRKALNDGLRIVVIYNSSQVDRTKCPSLLRYEGIHIPAYILKYGSLYWNYNQIRNAIMYGI